MLDSPVYRYVVTYTPSGPVDQSAVSLLSFPSRFSFHCLDAVTFFGGLETILGKPLSEEDKSFQDVITHHLVTFAKTGEHTSCPAHMTVCFSLIGWSSGGPRRQVVLRSRYR